jgi:hypothetical protein
LKANVAEVRQQLVEVQSQQSTLHAQLTASTDEKFKEAKDDSDVKFCQMMDAINANRAEGYREGGTKKKQNSGQ